MFFKLITDLKSFMLSACTRLNKYMCIHIHILWWLHYYVIYNEMMLLVAVHIISQTTPKCKTQLYFMPVILCCLLLHGMMANAVRGFNDINLQYC